MSKSYEFSDVGNVTNNAKTRKRKSHGRMRDVLKKWRVSTHEAGPDCKCKRQKCFERVSEGERKKDDIRF